MHGIGDRHGVATALALHRHHNRAAAVVPTSAAITIDAIEHLGHLAQLYRRTIAVGHHQLAVGRRIVELAVVLDADGLAFAVEVAGGLVGVTGPHGGIDLVQAQAFGAQGLGINANANGVFLGPKKLHLGHPIEGGEPLGDPHLGRLGDLGEGQQVGGEHQIKDRLLRRIHLADRGGRGQIRRQLACRLANGGLDILGGRIDVPIQVELEGDLAAALGATGTHLGNAGNARELLLQRGGHRGGHGGRTCPGQGDIHLQGGKIDAGQVADRQAGIAHHPKNHQGQHQQDRGDRTANQPATERAHHFEPCPGFCFARRIAAPGLRANWPLITTCSPGRRPDLTTTCSALVGPSCSWRAWATLPIAT